MKQLILIATLVALGCALTWWGASRRHAAFRAEQAERESRLLAELTELKSQLGEAQKISSTEWRSNAAVAGAAADVRASTAAPLATRLLDPGQSAETAISGLVDWSIAASTNGLRDSRQFIARLEKLVEMGPAAVPAIRDFLAQYEDVVFESGGPAPGRGPQWRQESIMPASLRDGLIDTLRRIGGPDAEAVLVETLGSTGRGYEVLSIAKALEELAPGAYRERILAATQALLDSPAPSEPAFRLDEHSREYLYDVLSLYGDAEAGAQASGRLVNANGAVDEAALRFFEKAPADVTLPAVYQALEDPRLADLSQTEPLLELAMLHVGADPQAGELFMSVMQSGEVSTRLQEKALRHLAGEGLENEDAPTATDLRILESRIQYLDAVRPGLTDPGLIGEWEKVRTRIINRLAAPTE